MNNMTDKTSCPTSQCHKVVYEPRDPVKKDSNKIQYFCEHGNSFTSPWYNSNDHSCWRFENNNWIKLNKDNMNTDNDLKIRCLTCCKNITLSDIRNNARVLIEFIDAYEEKTISAEVEKVIQLGINDTTKSRDQFIINFIKVRMMRINFCRAECFKKE